MTLNEAARVLATLKALWRNWEPTQKELDLWRNTILAWPDSQPIVEAAEESRRRDAQGFSPQIATVLAIANERHMAKRAESDADDRRAEYAREAEACRQDYEANRRFLDGQDAETLATAKAWLSQQPFASGLIRAAEKGRDRMACAFLVLAIRHRLWERGPKWWVHLKAASPLS